VSERILSSVYINPNHFVSLYCFPPPPRPLDSNTQKRQPAAGSWPPCPIQRQLRTSSGPCLHLWCVPLPFRGNGPENRIISIAGPLPDLSPLVLRPLQMPKVRVHHPNSARTHRAERAVRWNQGTQGAFKRVMTVCENSFDRRDLSLIVAPVLLFIEHTPYHGVLCRLLYHQVLGRLPPLV